MAVYKLDKKICLMDGTKIEIDIDIPVDGEIDFTQDYSFIDESFISSITRGVKNSIEKYKESELPNKYLQSQSIIITNNLPFYILGGYNGEDIYIDGDSIRNIRRLSGGFVVAHEEGHKIMNHINRDQTLMDIAELFGMTSLTPEMKFVVEEVFADACGGIVTGEKDYSYIYGKVSEDLDKEIKRRTLKNIYHI